MAPTAIKRKANPGADISSKKPKTSLPKAKPESEPQSESELQAEEAASSSSSDEVLLHGLSSDDEDSSDEEPAIDVAKLPNPSKENPSVKAKLEAASKKPSQNQGVVYVGRLPHGFYEAQLRSYFSQFGEVTRLRVSRNKKTGKSKHYAFVEFSSLQVAEVVVETMNNYLMAGHLLQCKIIPRDQLHPDIWLGSNRAFRPVPANRTVRKAHNQTRVAESQSRANKRLIRRQKKQHQKLQETGIKYNLEPVAYKPSS